MVTSTDPPLVDDAHSGHCPTTRIPSNAVACLSCLASAPRTRLWQARSRWAHRQEREKAPLCGAFRLERKMLGQRITASSVRLPPL